MQLRSSLSRRPLFAGAGAALLSSSTRSALSKAAEPSGLHPKMAVIPQVVVKGGGGELIVESANGLPEYLMHWNGITEASAVDIIIYLHGYIGNERLAPAWIDQRGLRLADRSRPTLLIIPRGTPSPIPKYAKRNVFSLLFSGNNVHRLIAAASQRLGTELSMPAAPAMARYILSGHSAGGHSIFTSLARGEDPVPHQLVFLDAIPCFDRNRSSLLSHWLEKSLRAKSPSDEEDVLFLVYDNDPLFGETAFDCARATIAATDIRESLGDRLRGFSTSVGHDLVPKVFGPVALSAALPPSNAKRLSLTPRPAGTRPTFSAIPCGT